MVTHRRLTLKKGKWRLLPTQLLAEAVLHAIMREELKNRRFGVSGKCALARRDLPGDVTTSGPSSLP
ncbi:MAG: hypothetical protein ACRDRT_17990 [Pseudonocardiaceae bacterium]